MIREATRRNAVEDIFNESTIRREFDSHLTFQGATEVDLTSTPSTLREDTKKGSVPWAMADPITHQKTRDEATIEAAMVIVTEEGSEMGNHLRVTTTAIVVRPVIENAGNRTLLLL